MLPLPFCGGIRRIRPYLTDDEISNAETTAVGGGLRAIKVGSLSALKSALQGKTIDAGLESVALAPELPLAATPVIPLSSQSPIGVGLIRTATFGIPLGTIWAPEKSGAVQPI
jgi:hypothetical protein